MAFFGRGSSPADDGHHRSILARNVTFTQPIIVFGKPSKPRRRATNCLTAMGLNQAGMQLSRPLHVTACASKKPSCGSQTPLVCAHGGLLHLVTRETFASRYFTLCWFGARRYHVCVCVCVCVCNTHILCHGEWRVPQARRLCGGFCLHVGGQWLQWWIVAAAAVSSRGYSSIPYLASAETPRSRRALWGFICRWAAGGCSGG
jgi:hypothetical protein